MQNIGKSSSPLAPDDSLSDNDLDPDNNGQILLTRSPRRSRQGLVDNDDDSFSPEALSILSDIPGITLSSSKNGKKSQTSVGIDELDELPDLLSSALPGVPLSSPKHSKKIKTSLVMDGLDEIPDLLSMPLSPAVSGGKKRESLAGLQDSIDDLESCVEQLAVRKQQEDMDLLMKESEEAKEKMRQVEEEKKKQAEALEVRQNVLTCNCEVFCVF